MKNFPRKNSSPNNNEYDLALDSIKSNTSKKSFKVKVSLTIGFLIGLLILLGLFVWFYPHFIFSPKTMFSYIEGKEINRHLDSVNTLFENKYASHSRKILSEPTKITYKINNIDLKNSNIIKIPPKYLGMLKFGNISVELEIDLKNNLFIFNNSLGLQNTKLFSFGMYQSGSDLGFYIPQVYDKNIVIDRTNIEGFFSKNDLSVPIKKFEVTELINNIILKDDEIDSFKKFLETYPKEIFEFISPNNFEFFEVAKFKDSYKEIECKKIVFTISKEELKKLHIYSLDKIEANETLSTIIGSRVNRLARFLSDTGLYDLEDTDMGYYKTLVSRKVRGIKNSNDLSHYYDVDYEMYFDKSYNLIGRKLLLKNDDSIVFELLHNKTLEENRVKHSVKLKNEFKNSDIIFYENNGNSSLNYSLDIIEDSKEAKSSDIVINYALNPLDIFKGDSNYNHGGETTIFGRTLQTKFSNKMNYTMEPKLNNLSTKGKVSHQHTFAGRTIDVNFDYKSSYLYGYKVVSPYVEGIDVLNLNESLSKEEVNELYNIFIKFKKNISKYF